jgi:hypothetical protein
VRFFGDPDLEPALDITALHTIRETRPNSNRQDVRVRVNIAGTINRPTLALSSADNPPLPESDLLSYLVTGEPAYALLGTPYAEQGATLALRLAGSYLSSRLAGGRFDVVQVEPTALNPGDAANLRENGLGILASRRAARSFSPPREERDFSVHGRRPQPPGHVRLQALVEHSGGTAFAREFQAAADRDGGSQFAPPRMQT